MEKTESPPKRNQAVIFVAVHRAVMKGQECIARARSSTIAKRIAKALNEHTPDARGV